jgi:hypothetical protein
LTWFFIIILSLFAAISISLVLFLFKTFSLSLAVNFKLPFLQLLFLIFPFFWFTFFILFFIIILIIYRKRIKNGYKYAWYEILIPFAIIIFILGLLMSLNDEINEHINTKTIERVPLYKNIEKQRTDFLYNPEEGSIYGTITEITESGIKILDIDDNNWDIDLQNTNFVCLHCLTFGKSVHITGNCNPPDCFSNYSFEAFEIRPFGRNILLKKHIGY